MPAPYHCAPGSALVLLLWAIAASAAPPDAVDPAEWLLQVSESSRLANYQGVVVYRDGQSLETLRIVHRHKDGREQERITSLSGAARDTVRDGAQIRCALSHVHPAQSRPAESADRPQSLLPVLSRETLRAVKPHYAFRHLGETRVAGRASRGVAIEPGDEFRYGYEVWADAQAAVPLKISLLDRKGRVIEQMLFTEIQYPARINDQVFAMATGMRPRAPRSPAAAASELSAAAAGAAGAWVLPGMPPGFRIAIRSLKPAAQGEGVVEHLLLTDGLSAVSIFSARIAPDEKLFRGFSHLGAMNAYGRTLGVYHVTVVGEVPQATVRMIGDGLTAAPP